MLHYLTYLNNSIKENWSKPAFTNFGAETYTYGQIAEGIEKYHILFEKSGIKKGDRIALYARNSAEWGIAFVAVTTYDAVVVPFLPDFNPSSVVELTEFSECKMIIVDTVAYNGFKNSEGLVERIGAIDGFTGIVNVKDITVLEAFNKELDGAVKSIDELYNKKYPNGLSAELINYAKSNDKETMELDTIISFTSGTTSATSKGVVLPARSISVNLEFARREIPCATDGHIFSILPMAHMFGMTFDFLFPLSSGCHVFVLPGKPTPARLLGGLAEVKPFMFLTVPMVIEKIFKSKVMPIVRKPTMRVLLAIPGINRIIYNTIKKKLLTAFGNGLTTGVIIGGAALNKDVEDLMNKMKFPYVVGYGMTECGPLISYCDKSKFVKTSCGTVAHPLEVRIDSSDPHRVLGEIQVKGDAVMHGYYRNPEATAAAFTKDGWLRTGDMGVIDYKGNIFIKGRCKNMILTGSGQNIYPEEIEDKLNNIPNVLESLVVGRGNALVALVVADYDGAKKQGISDEELENGINENVKLLNGELAVYSKIANVEFRRDAFEKTPKQSIRRFMYK